MHEQRVRRLRNTYHHYFGRHKSLMRMRRPLQERQLSSQKEPLVTLAPPPPTPSGGRRGFLSCGLYSWSWPKMKTRSRAANGDSDEVESLILEVAFLTTLKNLLPVFPPPEDPELEPPVPPAPNLA